MVRLLSEPAKTILERGIKTVSEEATFSIKPAAGVCTSEIVNPIAVVELFRLIV